MGDSVFSPGLRHNIVGQPDEPSPIDPSDPAAALEALRAFDHDHFLEAITKVGYDDFGNGRSSVRSTESVRRGGYLSEISQKETLLFFSQREIRYLNLGLHSTVSLLPSMMLHRTLMSLRQCSFRTTSFKLMVILLSN